MKDFFVTAWHRLTSSKVAWMAIPMAAAQIWLTVSGQDISAEVTNIFTALWSVVAVFLAVNNPEDHDKF